MIAERDTNLVRKGNSNVNTKTISVIFTMTIVVFGNARAETIIDCNVTANALFKTGEVVRGAASDLMGTELLDWIHEAPGIAFETVEDPNGGPEGPPGDDGIVCRTNGRLSVTFRSEGTASFNGVPGHSYSIAINDDRNPEGDRHANQIRLCSTLVQSPRTRNEGSSTFAMDRVVYVPETLPVVEGAAARGKARLSLGANKCSYRGTGATGDTGYLFERCNGPGGVSLIPGDTVVVSEVGLRIVSADRSVPVTSIQVDIGSDPWTGPADSYLIHIADPARTIIYSFSANVECGDIAIDHL